MPLTKPATSLYRSVKHSLEFIFLELSAEADARLQEVTAEVSANSGGRRGHLESELLVSQIKRVRDLRLWGTGEVEASLQIVLVDVQIGYGLFRELRES